MKRIFDKWRHSITEGHSSGTDSKKTENPAMYFTEEEWKHYADKHQYMVQGRPQTGPWTEWEKEAIRGKARDLTAHFNPSREPGWWFPRIESEPESEEVDWPTLTKSDLERLRGPIRRKPGPSAEQPWGEREPGGGLKDPWAYAHKYPYPPVSPAVLPTVLHNVEQLRTLRDRYGEGGLYRFFDRTFDKGTGPEKVMRILAQIPAMTNNQIKVLAGSGTQKIAYSLDNDHIFSFFKSGYQDFDDLDWYEGIQDRQFAGESSIDEPAVHDFGEISMHPDLDAKRIPHDGYLKYVEMSGITPLTSKPPREMGDAWDAPSASTKKALEGRPSWSELRKTRPSEGILKDWINWDIERIAAFVKDSFDYMREPLKRSLYDGSEADLGFNLREQPLEKQVALVQHWWRNRRAPWLKVANDRWYDRWSRESMIPWVLPRDLQMNLIKTFVNIVSRLGTTEALKDLHMGNLGMSKENPDEFVVIDI